MDSIVSRDTISRRAQQAADEQIPLTEANPYPPESEAARLFVIDYYARVLWLEGEETV